jgi:signal transduction histidine kinase
MDEKKIIIESDIKKEKLGFFKKFWYSITNFDKYLEMALNGPYKAMLYTIQLTFLMCIFLELGKVVNYIFTKGIPQSLINGNIINLITSQAMITKYISAVALFIEYFIIILTYVVLLAIIGYVTARILRVKMRYQAIYSLASYAVTLSTVLYTTYLFANIFTIFKMKYIAVGYMAIAYVYIVTAIFILKSDMIKKHQELMKIIEEQKKMREQMEKEKEKEAKENKDSVDDEKNESPKDESKEKDSSKKENKEEKNNDEDVNNEGLLEDDKDTKEPDVNEA